MTLHWWYVVSSWASVLGVFAALALNAMARLHAAKRQLAGLERSR